MTRRKSSRPPAAALLLIDVINPFDFPGAAALYRRALPAARRLAALKRTLRARGVPAIYVNDNFGGWDLGFRELVDRLRGANGCGAPIIELLAPQAGDHFILKPKHSGFYGTSLELLLDHLGARVLVLTGFAANICVWFTANDAHMRGYRVVVARDCVASERSRDTTYVLEQMRRVMDAKTIAARDVSRVIGAPGTRAANVRSEITR